MGSTLGYRYSLAQRTVDCELYIEDQGYFFPEPLCTASRGAGAPADVTSESSVSRVRNFANHAAPFLLRGSKPMHARMAKARAETEGRNLTPPLSRHRRSRRRVEATWLAAGGDVTTNRIFMTISSKVESFGLCAACGGSVGPVPFLAGPMVRWKPGCEMPPPSSGP